MPMLRKLAGVSRRRQPPAPAHDAQLIPPARQHGRQHGRDRDQQQRRQWIALPCGTPPIRHRRQSLPEAAAILTCHHRHPRTSPIRA
jgi:hypothetical protein